MEIEQFLGSPQDIEWTVTEHGITVLQSRSIATFAPPDANGWDAEDKRPWYVSLTRSHSNLTMLRERIEREILPEMSAESDAMKAVHLNILKCDELKKNLLTVKNGWTTGRKHTGMSLFHLHIQSAKLEFYTITLSLRKIRSNSQRFS